MSASERPLWQIIANPAAGGGKMARRWPEIERCLQELGIAYSVQFTEKRGHAAQLLEAALLKGRRHILGIGGDGTNHEIANGILCQNIAPSTDIYYALLPSGTGNDWARMHGISTDIRMRLNALSTPKTVLQDAGFVQYVRDGNPASRYFVNVAGLAYDAFIAKKIEEKGRRIQSRLLYLLMIGRYLMEYKLSKAVIHFDERRVEDLFYTINVGICKYSGGGMQLTPHAVPDDGLLALTYARRVPKWDVLLQTHRFYNGSILSHSQIDGFQTKNIRIEHAGATPTFLEADGEFLGETPVEFSILEKVLRVVL
jgi:diacylglycerol kinase (ATP)